LAAINFPNSYAFAKARRRRGCEFTRTTVIAIARLEIVSVKKPFLHLMILLVGFRPASADRLLSRSSQRRVRVNFALMPPVLFQSVCKIPLPPSISNFVSSEKDKLADRGRITTVSTLLPFR